MVVCPPGNGIQNPRIFRVSKWVTVQNTGVPEINRHCHPVAVPNICLEAHNVAASSSKQLSKAPGTREITGLLVFIRMSYHVRPLKSLDKLQVFHFYLGFCWI